MMALLLENSADINRINYINQSALIKAINREQLDAAIWLVENGIDVDVGSDDNRPSLQLAISKGKSRISRAKLI